MNSVSSNYLVLRTCAIAVGIALTPDLAAQILFDRVTKDHVESTVDPLLSPVLGDFDGDGDLDVISGGRLTINFLGRFVSVPVSHGIGGAYSAHDFDGDGRADLFDGTRGVDESGVSLNRLPLTFQRQAFSFLPSRRPLAAHAVADFDGDGDLDIVISVDSFSVPVFQLVNDGRGNFSDATATRMPGAGMLVEGTWPLDADGDGDQDLIVFNHASGRRLELMVNQGGGVLGPPDPTRFSAAATTVFHSFDIDADGDPDVVADNGKIFLNQQGVFTLSPVHMLRRSVYTGAVRTADFDTDGDLDAWIDYRGAERSRWFENPGNGGPFLDRRASGPFVRRDVGDVAITDVDGDGMLDVLSVEDRIEVLLGQPAGRFLDLSPEAPLGIAYGDFNGDGFTDSLFHGALFEMFLRRSDGTGGYDEQPAAPGFQATAIHGQADVDGDGDLDLLVQRWIPFNNGAYVLINDGTGSFQDLSGAMPSIVREVRWSHFRDFDGDGDLDLFVHYGASNLFGDSMFLRNDGTGRFSADPSWQILSLQGRNLVTAMFDPDGDGDPDLVAGDDDPVLYRNDGTGRMTVAPGAIPGLFATFNVRPSELSVADIDGDGDDDFLVSYTFRTNPSGASRNGSLFQNDGTGTFSVRDVFSGAREWTSGQLVDVDDDGDADLVAGSQQFLGGQYNPRVDIYDNDGGGVLTLGLRTFGGVTSVYLGEFLDADDDGDVDFAGGLPRRGMISNLTRQLRSRFVPRLGGTLELEIPNPDPGNSRSAFFVLSPARLARPLPIPGFGQLIVDPTVGVAVFARTQFRGVPVELSVPVPNTASLGGVDVYVQALVDPSGQPRLTNAIRETLAF